jgi:hypothetical protein
MVPDAKYKIRSEPIKGIKELKRKYDIKHIEFADLLVPANAIESVFKESGNLDMTFELSTRTDMIKHDDIHKLKILADGGLTAMYIGIESLHPQCLKLMRKGHLAIHCVSFMKWAKHYGIRVDWKLLFGIPFEKSEYYVEMLEVLQKIPHLPPPLIQPILITKRSPYYKELRPLKVAEAYNRIYPDYLDLEKIAQDFEFLDTEFITNKAKNLLIIEKLILHVKYWNNVGSNCSLTMADNVVLDNRYRQRQATKMDDDQAEVLNFCDIPRKAHEVRNKFSQTVIQDLCNKKFLLELDHRLVSLIEPQRV